MTGCRVTNQGWSHRVSCHFVRCKLFSIFSILLYCKLGQQNHKSMKLIDYFTLLLRSQLMIVLHTYVILKNTLWQWLFCILVSQWLKSWLSTRLIWFQQICLQFHLSLSFETLIKFAIRVSPGFIYITTNMQFDKGYYDVKHNESKFTILKRYKLSCYISPVDPLSNISLTTWQLVMTPSPRATPVWW